jgi:TolB-like protein
MSDVFISYARSTEARAHKIAQALRTLGYAVWRDDDLPAHRNYAEVIEERIRSAKALVVVWSADAAKSEWVQSEADRARTDRKLVQLTIDGFPLPMPFDRIQCADLSGWTGDLDAPGWRKVVASIDDLMGGDSPAAMPAAKPAAETPLQLPSKPSVAVLPFTDMTGSEGHDYFVDGMVVEITNALSRFKSIFVIASGSSLSFKNKGLSPQDAAQQLGVRYVLEGSVRKAGGRVRIALQLIDAANGAQIWTRLFEDTLEDVFALQDKVALGVAGVIEPAVHQAEIRHVSARPTELMGSYDLYLRALPLYRTTTKSTVLEAFELLNRAIALDPDYGPALGLAARCRYLIDLYGWSDDTENNRREGIELAYRALKAAGDDANVLAIVAGVLEALEPDHRAAVALVDRAIALNPGSAYVWFVSGAIRVRAGETDLAIQHLETSMRLDPVGPERLRLAVFLAMARFQQGCFGEAARLSKECVQQTDHPTGFACLAASYGHLGQTRAALEALTRYRALAPQPIEVYARAFLVDPGHLKLFLDGIALAAGASLDERPD